MEWRRQGQGVARAHYALVMVFFCVFCEAKNPSASLFLPTLLLQNCCYIKTAGKLPINYRSLFISSSILSSGTTVSSCFPDRSTRVKRRSSLVQLCLLRLAIPLHQDGTRSPGVGQGIITGGNEVVWMSHYEGKYDDRENVLAGHGLCRRI
jgi:hypothetical protein